VWLIFYRKDRFNKPVFLSLSLCTKRSILSGWRNSTDAVFKGTPSQTWRQHSWNNKWSVVTKNSKGSDLHELQYFFFSSKKLKMSVDQQLSQDTKNKKKNLKFIEANHDQGWNSRKFRKRVSLTFGNLATFN